MSSSSTHLLDSDLVNEWSELLHHEQELISPPSRTLFPTIINLISSAMGPS
ncbi:Hypothetical protein FKW44_015300 [Caligus rogercresseyi]|uniref:Uncharacterized protein n=1 Tax=Caligus rogercresseyi TaxID=217165 RepID=A0A7T8H040_CALRO|nr:Hypothetical protein FKW44_015300 [Caligus rogercresseyi]